MENETIEFQLKDEYYIESENHVIIIRGISPNDKNILWRLDKTTDVIQKIILFTLQLGLVIDGSSEWDISNILRFDREMIRNLTDLYTRFQIILDSFDLDEFYGNVWRMNGGNFNNLEYFENMPLSKYSKLVEIHNKETSKHNAQLQNH